MFRVERIYFQGILRIDKTLTDIDRIVRSAYADHVRSLIKLLEFEDISCGTYIMTSEERVQVDSYRTMYDTVSRLGDIYKFSMFEECNYIELDYTGSEGPVGMQLYFNGKGGLVSHSGFRSGVKLLRRNVDKLEESRRYLDDIALLKEHSVVDGAYLELTDDVVFKSVGSAISMIKGYGTSLWQSNEVVIHGIDISLLGDGKSTYKDINKRFRDILVVRRYNNTNGETLALVLNVLESKLKYLVSSLDFSSASSVLLEVKRLGDVGYFKDLVSNIERYYLETQA